jgi:hypothetical protein
MSIPTPFIADRLPILPAGIRTIEADFRAFGTCHEANIEPGSPIQFRRFNIDFPIQPSGRQDCPHGWNWDYFTITFQRITAPDRPPFATFFADWKAQSYGRWSGDSSLKSLWTFDVVLMERASLVAGLLRINSKVRFLLRVIWVNSPSHTSWRLIGFGWRGKGSRNHAIAIDQAIISNTRCSYRVS